MHIGTKLSLLIIFLPIREKSVYLLGITNYKQRDGRH